MNFDQWYKDFCSDERWFQLLRAYKDKTIEKAAKRVFAQLVADKCEDSRPMSENRKHVYNILCKTPGDKVLVPWQVQALKKLEVEQVQEEWKPASDEHVKKCIAEFDEMMKNAPMLNYRVKLTEREKYVEGDWEAKRPEPWPCTSKEEAYIRDRHFEYIKYAYEPRTGLKREGVLSEEEFNKQFDREHL